MKQARNLSCGVPDDLLRRFAAGETRGADRRQVLEHLLVGCRDCRIALRSYQQRIDVDRQREEPPTLSNLLSTLNLKAAQIERERNEATALMEKFSRHPVSRQWTLVRNSRRFDTWQFASQLLDQALAAIYDDARRSLELARMSQTLSERLDAAIYGARLLVDLQVRARAYVGNGLRGCDQLPESELALAAARRSLADGTGDPLLEAELLYFESSLARARRSFPKALAKARASQKIYRELGDAHLEGRSVLGEGTIHLVQGDAVAALGAYRRAFEMIDAERDPRLGLASRHNLVRALAINGDLAGATSALASFRSDYARLGDRTSLAKLAWLEGRIHQESGETAAAETAFRSAIRLLSELELPYSVAMVSLDLAALLADRGSVAELRALAAEMLVTFRALEIEREAIAAWLVFSRAAEAETVTTGLLQRLAAYYESAKLRPGLAFRD
jgi:tetratricopeptide (TPR) repeat protein